MSWLSQRGAFAAGVMFLAGWMALSAPWLFGDVTIPYDAKAHFQAQIQFLARAIHSGQSPFWAPNVFAGSPQIADPQSLIFSPALLLALVNPSPSFRALDALVLVTLAIGGLAIIGFFKDRGWHPAGAVIAALGYAFGASAAWRIQHVGQIESYVFFATTLFLLARALDRASWAWGVAAGASAALMLVKPDQVAYLGALALAGYVVDHLLRSERLVAGARRALLPLTAASVAGAALLALPILLTYLFASESNRPEISYGEAARGSLHPASLLTFVVSDLFGAYDPKVEYWGPSSSAWNPGELFLSQNMGQIYLGAVPALAVLTFGLLRGYLFAAPVRYFSIAAVLFTLYAVGWYTPAFKLFFDYLPGVSVFRRPADATFLIGALLSIVAGYCLHRWLADAEQRPVWTLGAKALIVAAAIACAVAVSYRLGKFGLALDPLMKATLWIAAGAVVLVAARRTAARAPAIAVILPALLLVADLRANNGPNESTALPAKHYDVLDPDTKNETIRFLKERLAQKGPSDRRDRVELVGLGYAWPNAGLVHGFDHTLGFNPLRLAEFAEATGAGDTIAGPDQKQFTPVFPRYNCRLANLLGLRYVVSSVPIEQVDTRFRPGDLTLIKRTTDGYIYENPRARPRVMFAQDWRLADFESIVETGRWPEFDPAVTVLLESDPAAAHPHIVAPAAGRQMASAGGDLAMLPPSAMPQLAPETPVAKALVAKYHNTEVEISVDTQQPGFVILNDVWHPWWRATLNGAPAPILKANVLFRAVQVPAGKHVLRFSFAPFGGAIAELRERLDEDE